MKNPKIIALTTTMVLAGGLFAQTNFDQARQKGHSTPVYRVQSQTEMPMQASMSQETSGMTVATQRSSDAQLGAEVYGPDGKMLGRVTQVHRDAQDSSVAYEVTAITPENTLGDAIRVSESDVEFHNDGAGAYATVTPGVRTQLAGLPANQGDSRYLPDEALVSNQATARPTSAQDFSRSDRDTSSVAMNEDNVRQDQLVERSTMTRPNEARRVQSRNNGTGLFRNNEVVASVNDGQTTRTYFETASPADDDMDISSGVSAGSDRPIHGSNDVGAVYNAEPTGLKDALHQELEGSAEAQEDLRQIQIHRDGDAVVLEGTVSSEKSKTAIEKALKKTTAMSIRNELEVE